MPEYSVYMSLKFKRMLLDKVDNAEYLRADGRCVCEICNLEYQYHLRLDYIAPTFALLCNNKIVKL